MVAVSSSAPTLPCLARPSDSLVNPEMSTNTTVPGSTRYRSPGRSDIHSMLRRGRYGARAWDRASPRSGRPGPADPPTSDVVVGSSIMPRHCPT